jgi:Arc/MetJ family transcription regulator
MCMIFVNIHIGDVVRTNIEISDKKIAQVMKILGTTTKKDTVDSAFDEIIRMSKQRGMLELRGKIQWEGDLDAWRRD